MLVTNLTRTGMGYVMSVFDSLSPEEELFRFEVSVITKSQWGIRGRVTVRTRIATARTVPTRGGYVTTETLDFLSGRSRQLFAERLGELIPPPPGGAAIDWPVVVEGLVVGVMDAEHRQPVIHDLSVTPAVSYTPHLIPYLLPEGKATILYGAGGTGKSAFAAAIASAVQTGVRLLGWQPIQRNVLYLDWETDEGDVAHRIGATSRGLGLTAPAPVRYMALELPLELEMAHIASAVAENDIGLVIIDSVGMASTQGRDGSDPAEAAIQFFRALRILRATVLCIDHISGEDMRRGKSGASKPYGSVFKWNSARNAFELIDSGPDQLILRHRKANLGPKMDGGELNLRIQWDTVTDTITYRRESAVAPAFTTAERMKMALETGPGSYKTLIDVLNSEPMYDPVNEADLRVASRELLSSESIVIDHQGVIRLTKGDGGDGATVDNNTLPLALEDVDNVDS